MRPHSLLAFSLCATLVASCAFHPDLGAEGEGEGEGEPDNCDKGDLFPPEGDLLLSGCVLEESAGGFDCAAFGLGDSYIVSCTVSGSVRGDCLAECSGDEVTLSVDGEGPRQFCSEVPRVNGAFLVCPICLNKAPGDLAIQLDDDGNGVSNAACVDLSEL